MHTSPRSQRFLLLILAIFGVLAFFVVSSVISIYTTQASSVTFKVAIIASAQCYNGLDDDGDTLIDSADNGCSDPTDNQEASSSGGNTNSGGNSGGNTTVIIINNPTPPPATPPDITLDAAPEKESSVLEDLMCTLFDSGYRRCTPNKRANFAQFTDDIVCEGFIEKKSPLSAYQLEKKALRQDILSIAVNMRREGYVYEKEYTRHFRDIGLPNQPVWLLPAVETGLKFGITSKSNMFFRPNDTITRAEAFAMVMKGVCMNPDIIDNALWQKRVFLIAKEHGITSKTWETFLPNSDILNQELFVIASRLADWADKTGGCKPRPAYCSVEENVSSEKLSSFTRVYELGDIHPEIRIIQRILNNHGYTVSTSGAGSAGQETEKYGFATQEAVRRFQKNSGIPMTGKVGELTYNALRNLDT